MIQDYLDTTRQHNEDVSQSLASFYQSLYDRLISISHATIAGPTPTLLVINTLNKKTQLVPLGGSRYLIHDQYLGQTINELTRIFYSATSPNDAKAMAYRLMSEAATCCGRIEVATLLAYLYSVAFHQAHEYLESETVDQLATRSAAVCVQEAYVIAHEIAHHLWPYYSLDPLAIDLLLESLIDDDEVGDIDEMVQTYLDDLSFQYHGKAVPHSENIKTDEDRRRDQLLRQDLRNKFLEDHAHEVALKAGLIKDPVFREEVYADWRAAQACLQLFSNEMRAEDLLIATHLAMENVTTISLAVELMNNVFGFESNSNSLIVATRKRAMRRSLEYWMADKINNGELVEHTILKRANVRYMQMVRDPITIDVASRISAETLPAAEQLREMRRDIIAAIPEAKDPQFIIRSRPFK
jgi:hypothetical protein